MKKLNIVWICTISNKQIYSKIKFASWNLKNILTHLLGRKFLKERAQWNTNAIKEFEKFEDILLTVIFPYGGIEGPAQKFSINGIDYICYKEDDDSLFAYILGKIIKSHSEYPKARRIVKSLINELQPDIVHVIGAENPCYSICALDIPKNIPCVVSLQTLLSSPAMLENNPYMKDTYKYRVNIEQKVIQRSNYIASCIKVYNAYIKKYIKKDATFLQMPLALGVDINMAPSVNEYDFVYFANNINKAADDAIEAFALACKVKPLLTLNISGGYDKDYKFFLEKRIRELGIEKNIFITGSKQTHDEVICQIKKSRYALLPLKTDLISSTVREAMACGLPVVTTITPATPSLNKERESVLLSEKGDYQAMANNMLRLVRDADYVQRIRENATLTVLERYNNETFMNAWRKAYYEIVDNFKNGTPFSNEIIYEG